MVILYIICQIGAQQNCPVLSAGGVSNSLINRCVCLCVGNEELEITKGKKGSLEMQVSERKSGYTGQFYLVALPHGRVGEKTGSTQLM